jgi:hypothetical protein
MIGGGILLQSAFEQTTTSYSETLAYGLGALFILLVLTLRYATKWTEFDADEKAVAKAARRAIRATRRTRAIAPTVEDDIDEEPAAVREAVAQLLEQRCDRAPRFYRLRVGIRRTLAGFSPWHTGQIRPLWLTHRPRIRAGTAPMPGGERLFVVRLEDGLRPRSTHVLTGTDRDQVLDDVATTWAAIRATRDDGRRALGVPGTLSSYHATHAREGCVDQARVRDRCHGDTLQRLAMNIRDNDRLDVALLFERMVYGDDFGYPPEIVVAKLRRLLNEETRLRDGDLIRQ